MKFENVKVGHYIRTESVHGTREGVVHIIKKGEINYGGEKPQNGVVAYSFIVRDTPDVTIYNKETDPEYFL